MDKDDYKDLFRVAFKLMACVAKHLFEVAIYDYEPACFMMCYHLFQEGCEYKREIDMMSDDERAELRAKQLKGLYLLGSSLRNQTK